MSERCMFSHTKIQKNVNCLLLNYFISLFTSKVPHSSTAVCVSYDSGFPLILEER